ncbi:hypothetical protein HDU93_008588 [Gonapodya sp. JEL0774]|nr:hypothetical protein HDU93_008588 [Gonapodya sp. JEL0774]
MSRRERGNHKRQEKEEKDEDDEHVRRDAKGNAKAGSRKATRLGENYGDDEDVDAAKQDDDADSSADRDWASSSLASASGGSGSSISLSLAQLPTLTDSHPPAPASAFALKSRDVNACLAAERTQHKFVKSMGCGWDGREEMGTGRLGRSSGSWSGWGGVGGKNDLGGETRTDSTHQHAAGPASSTGHPVTLVSASPWYSFAKDLDSTQPLSLLVPHPSATHPLSRPNTDPPATRTKEVLPDGTVLQWVWPIRSPDLSDRAPSESSKTTTPVTTIPLHDPPPTPRLPSPEPSLPLPDPPPSPLKPPPPRALSATQLNRRIVKAMGGVPGTFPGDLTADTNTGKDTEETQPNTEGRKQRQALLASLRPSDPCISPTPTRTDPDLTRPPPPAAASRLPSSPTVLHQQPAPTPIRSPLPPPPAPAPTSPSKPPTTSSDPPRRMSWGTPPRPIALPVPLSFSKIPNAASSHTRRDSTSSTHSATTSASSSSSSASHTRTRSAHQHTIPNPTVSWTAGVGVRVFRPHTSSGSPSASSSTPWPPLAHHTAPARATSASVRATHSSFAASSTATQSASTSTSHSRHRSHTSPAPSPSSPIDLDSVSFKVDCWFDKQVGERRARRWSGKRGGKTAAPAAVVERDEKGVVLQHRQSRDVVVDDGARAVKGDSGKHGVGEM